MEWRNSTFETLLVCFLLVLGCTKAQEKNASAIKMFENPFDVNLAPFIQMRSAYRCTQNVSVACPGKYQLTYVGWVNVTPPDTGTYCSNCADQTKLVLTCISLVKHGFKFVDGTTVHDINYTISDGCAHGFTGKVLRVSGA